MNTQLHPFGCGHETHAIVKFVRFANRPVRLVALAHGNDGQQRPCVSCANLVC